MIDAVGAKQLVGLLSRPIRWYSSGISRTWWSSPQRKEQALLPRRRRLLALQGYEGGKVGRHRGRTDPGSIQRIRTSPCDDPLEVWVKVQDAKAGIPLHGKRYERDRSP
jgi:hypothetical protein